MKNSFPWGIWGFQDLLHLNHTSDRFMVYCVWVFRIHNPHILNFHKKWVFGKFPFGTYGSSVSYGTYGVNLFLWST